MVEKALDAGADEFLVKPVPKNVLIAYINNLTRRARAERAAAQHHCSLNSGSQPESAFRGPGGISRATSGIVAVRQREDHPGYDGQARGREGFL